MKGENTIHSTE